MDDLISKQAAIDEIKESFKCGDYLQATLRRLENLPSVQPEIIRCKDCKYGYPINEVYVQCMKAHRTAERHKKGWFCPDGEKV